MCVGCCKCECKQEVPKESFLFEPLFGKLETAKVTRHCYRTAEVGQRFLMIHYNSQEKSQAAYLHEWLAEKCGKELDNHVCFEIEFNDGTKLYLQFSDWVLYVGLRIWQRTW